MLNEIVKKYGNLSDSLISEIIYYAVDGTRRIEVILDCMNALNDYEYEKMKLTFNYILSIHFSENENQSTTSINSALIANDSGIIVFDFFPLISGEGNLKENENSDFKIKCKEVSYSLVD
jgi:hypothetical protein